MRQHPSLPASPPAPRAPAPARDAVRVLAVDDHAVFRGALCDLLAATPGFEQVGQAASGSEALELAARLRPDLVLLDVRMPGLDGVQTARLLAERVPDATVVLMSLEPPPESVAAEGLRHLRKQELSTSALRALWPAATDDGPRPAH